MQRLDQLLPRMEENSRVSLTHCSRMGQGSDFRVVGAYRKPKVKSLTREEAMDIHRWSAEPQSRRVQEVGTLTADNGA